MNRDLLDNRTIQQFLSAKKLYTLRVDGDYGRGTRAAADQLLIQSFVSTVGWDDDRKRTAVEQLVLRGLGFPCGNPDGWIGPQTLDALERYQNKIRDIEPPVSMISHMPTVWPRERSVLEFFGGVGKNQATLDLPYEMKIAWNTKQTVHRITCHSKVKDSLGRIFSAALATYGAGTISDLGLDMFGGCLNVRAKKGGRAYSMHSWGIAVDLDPEHNSLRAGRPQARFSHPEYVPFWNIVESEGWVSLGREKNYDWMHFQAARF